MDDYIRHDRGYLPHIEFKGACYFVTFRLADSLPSIVLAEWKHEIETIGHARVKEKSHIDPFIYFKKVEEYLDSGRGACSLKKPEIAELVVQALKHFDSIRYVLHAWCVMPNHVHVVLEPISSDGMIHDLPSILHSWKSFTAHKVNKVLDKKGKFWQEEYFDRIIRDAGNFRSAVIYTLENPVKAGLCKVWKDWSCSGCSEAIMKDLDEGTF